MSAASAATARRRAVRLLERLRNGATVSFRRPLLRDAIGHSVMETDPGRMAYDAVAQAGYYDTAIYGPVPEWLAAIDRAIKSLEASDAGVRAGGGA